MLDPAAVHADPLGLLVAFGAGMLSFLSPCVLPLVPAYLSMVSGLSAAELSALQDGPRTPTARVPVGAGVGGTGGAGGAGGAGGVAGTGTAGAGLAGAGTAGAGTAGAGTAGAGTAGSGSETVVARADGPVGTASLDRSSDLTLSGTVSSDRDPSGLDPFGLDPSGLDPPGLDGGIRPADLRRERSRLLRGILAFIAGFTVVFTILGASASAIGRLFLTHQRALETVSGILIVVFGAVLVAMAAGLRLPVAVVGERRFAVRPSVLGVWAPPIMGMAFAFAWTPCIGPVLASVLALAAGTGGSAAGGIALLLAYSLGLGVPFLLSGLALGRMTDMLARVRGRLRWVDLVGGTILVAFGVLLLTGHVDVVSAHISGWLHDLHLDRLSVS